MKLKLLTTLIAAAVLVTAFPFLVPTAHALSSNNDCYANNEGQPLPYDEWSKFIKISIPIPTLTNKLYCYNHGADREIDAPVDQYYYTTSLGAYLANFYQWFVSIVGILGAVMIMYGGIRWVLAAGNQSRIQGAKNVIFSAVIGIVIAFGSYLLLFLLNPRLVDYTTLETYLVPVTAIAQESEFCEDVSNPTRGNGLPSFAFQVYEQSSERKDLGCAGFDYDQQTGLWRNLNENMCFDEELCKSCGIPTTRPDLGTWCGDKVGIIPYDVIVDSESTPNVEVSTCRGQRCELPWQTCVKADNVLEGYDCMDSWLHGNIAYEGNAYIDFMWLGARCNDGQGVQTNFTLDQAVSFITEPLNWVGLGSYHYEELPILDLSEGEKSYSFPSSRFSNGIDYDRDRIVDAIAECDDGHGGLGGFYLQVEVNDDTTLISPTSDDDFVVDRNCQPLTPGNPADITDAEWRVYILSNRLITEDDIFDTLSGNLKTYQCNFNVTRQSYPAR